MLTTIFACVTFQGGVLDSLCSQKWPLGSSLDYDGDGRVAAVADLSHFLVRVRQLDGEPCFKVGSYGFEADISLHLRWGGETGKLV